MKKTITLEQRNNIYNKNSYINVQIMRDIRKYKYKYYIRILYFLQNIESKKPIDKAIDKEL